MNRANNRKSSKTAEPKILIRMSTASTLPAKREQAKQELAQIESAMVTAQEIKDIEEQLLRLQKKRDALITIFSASR